MMKLLKPGASERDMQKMMQKMKGMKGVSSKLVHVLLINEKNIG
jgi:hypothetical protein